MAGPLRRGHAGDPRADANHSYHFGLSGKRIARREDAWGRSDYGRVVTFSSEMGDAYLPISRRCHHARSRRSSCHVVNRYS